MVPLVESISFLAQKTFIGSGIANLAVGNTTTNTLTYIFSDVESEGAVDAGEA